MKTKILDEYSEEEGVKRRRGQRKRGGDRGRIRKVERGGYRIITEPIRMYKPNIRQ